MRYKPGEIDPPRFQDFTFPVDHWMTVLDAMEYIRTNLDATLLYRHSCHHASCGTCAMKVNGREVLSCVTNVLELGAPVVTVEPLGVLPHIADLVVDMTAFAEHFEPAGMQLLRRSEFMPEAARPEGIADYTRYENCLECAACISACPVTNTNSGFIGPAGLAATYRALIKGDAPAAQCYAFADGEDGAWRCHTAWECSAVCPSDVDPAGQLVQLRRRMLGYKVRRLFGGKA
jgi:succinate dehydrogenase / fumarate reductase iron-sulfur subunit